MGRTLEGSWHYLSTPEGTAACQASFWLLLSRAGEKKTPTPLELKKLGSGEALPCAVSVILFGDKVSGCWDSFTCGDNPCQATLDCLKWKA